MVATLIVGVVVVVLIVMNQSINSYLVDFLGEKDIENVSGEVSEEWFYKRVRKAKVVFILFVGWPSVDYHLVYGIGVVFLAFLTYKQEYFKVKTQQKRKLRQLRFQFPIWLRQLQILIQTNTIVTSLRLSQDSAPELIEDDLRRLIVDIEADAIHLTPYLNFLKQYRLSEIERAMKLLYRYNTVGKDDAYVQFHRMIQTTTKWLRSERGNRNESKLMTFQWWGMLPLFGVTVLFMAIMFEIMIGLFGKGVS